MVTRLTVVDDADTRTASEWVHDADDDVLSCRGQQHNFPKIRKGRARKGIRVIPLPEVPGVFQVEFTCQDCGTKRTIETQPGGVIAMPSRYRYVYPPGYKGPKGVRIGKREAFAETMRRTVEDGRMYADAESA
jgi:hypothetical protein